MLFFSYHTIEQKGDLPPMVNISQFLHAIQSLSSQLFVFRTNMEPLAMLNRVPDDVQALLDSAEFNEYLATCTGVVTAFNDFLKPFLKIIHKATYNKSKKDPMIPYADFKVDEAPILITAEPEQIKAEDLIALNNIKPVNRRTNEFPYEGDCPNCGADHRYIYPNNKKNQYRCKVCKKTFTDKVVPRNTSGYYCPHCKHKLNVHHDRKGYVVYVCGNRRCSYYKENKAKKDTSHDDELLTSSRQFRYRYHYREFKFNMNQIRDYTCEVKGKVNLSKIHVSERVLGLVLTYYINYGLSARKVSNLMRDVHGVRISHQTIWNYATSVSALIKDMLDYYPYDLTHTQVGDETYVHILGKNNYVFFFSDPKNKIITSYYIFPTRDTENAVKSMWNVLKKFSPYPDDLEFITDGNPIYNAAQLFFGLQGFDFDLHQVIGVKNHDEVSKKYRAFKQTEERLNRTFKENYYPLYGFKDINSANAYMVLYVAFFNFLRRHSSLEYETPVQLDCFDEYDLMPDKWLKLINESAKYIRTSSQMS